MASERQIEANRRNSARSTGPRSEAGKARSRGNATRHGMAGESTEVVEAKDSAAFRARREAWAKDLKPSGPAGDWALDRAVAASLRIERCERAVEGLVEATARRARLSWDQDREVEAAALAAGLAKAPGLVARKLAATYHGAGIMAETWERLEASPDGEGEWDKAECSTALDLLGIPADLRRGPTPIDDPAGGDLRAFRLAIASREIARLDDLRDESLADLDDFAREQAMDGDLAMLGKDARLLLRYERDAWRRYRETLRDLQDPTPPAPAPDVAPPPAPTARASVPPPARPRTLRLDPTNPWDAEFAEMLRDSGLEDFEEIDLSGIIEGASLPGTTGAPPAPTERSQSGGALARPDDGKRGSRLANPG